MSGNTIEPGRRAQVDVPASTANLGPGFDSLGMGVEIRDELQAEVVGDALVIEVRGAGAGQVPLDEGHLVYRSMLTLWDRLDIAPPRGLKLLCNNVIPHSRGLGSSASAIVGGVALGWMLTGQDWDDRAQAVVNDVASELEGHPDNASASVYGGFTSSWYDDAEKRWCTVKPELAADIDIAVFVPEATLATDKARSALPAQVPLADAARNAGRAALLVHALTTDPGLLLPATADWLHQENRRPAYPRSMALVDELRADGHAAFISGAGPTVLVVGRTTDLGRIQPAGPGWELLRPGIATVGVRAASHFDC